MKCLHIFAMPRVRHNESIVAVINDLKKDSSVGDIKHDFIVFDKEVYDEFKDKCSCFYSDSEILKAINKYGKDYDWVFMHCMRLTPIQVLRLNGKVMHKMIWVCWGHDLYLTKETTTKTELMKNLLRKIKWFIADRRLKKIYAIGIGFKYDAFEVVRRFNNMRILRVPYGYKKNKKLLVDSTIEESTPPDDGIIRVAIGHSASEFLRHIEIMKLLEKFKNEPIKISLILSYGDKEYAQKVKEYAIKNWGEKAEIIEEYMEYCEYIKYLSKMDIAIFANKHQSALANISLLNYMGKKLFLAKDGILKMAMDFEMIESYSIESIEKMTFNEFSKPIQKIESSVAYGKFSVDEQYSRDTWKHVLIELDSCK